MHNKRIALNSKGIVRFIFALILLTMLCVTFGFNSNAAGWEKKGSKWKYQTEQGYVKSKWMYLNYGWYYFDKKGNMVTGLKKIKGETYYFTPVQKGAWREGMRMFGWQRINGKYMYFDTTGKLVNNPNSQEVGTIKGIDVSQYQGNINWTKMRQQGIRFTFVRVGHGTHNIDPYYQRNMINAHAAGVKTGIYFYSTARTPAQSRNDARWVISQLKGYTVNYPVAIDLEENSQAALGRDRITAIAKAFCDEIRAAGYTPMIYSNENWAINFVSLDKLPGVYRWIARYNGYFNETITRQIWQAGSTLTLDGIDVNTVDIDFAYVDFSKIVKPRTKPIKGYKSNVKGFVTTTLGTYYDNGDGTYPAKCWKKIGSKWYHFDAMGYIQNGGWLTLGDRHYYLRNNGSAYINEWLYLDEGKYYFKSNGIMAQGLTKIGEKTYIFKPSGPLVTGWWTAGGKYYFVGHEGYLRYNTWISYAGKKFFMTQNGYAAVGAFQIGSKKYYFNGLGELQRNAHVDGYVTDAEGVIIDTYEVTQEPDEPENPENPDVTNQDNQDTDNQNPEDVTNPNNQNPDSSDNSDATNPDNSNNSDNLNQSN